MRVQQALMRLGCCHGATDGVLAQQAGWPTPPSQRMLSLCDPARFAARAAPRLASVAEGLRSTGGGVHLDPMSIGTVAADCGQVLGVDDRDSILQNRLWAWTAPSGTAAAPAIKI